MTSEIEETFLKRCEVVHCNSAWARIMVSDTTRESLKSLEQKYDKTGRHIRKLYGFISKLPDGEVFSISMKIKHPLWNEELRMIVQSFSI